MGSTRGNAMTAKTAESPVLAVASNRNEEGEA